MNHLDQLRAPLMVAVGQGDSDEFQRQSCEFYEAGSRVVEGSIFEEVLGSDHFSTIESLLDAESSMCRWIAQCAGLATE